MEITYDRNRKYDDASEFFTRVTFFPSSLKFELARGYRLYLDESDFPFPTTFTFTEHEADQAFQRRSVFWVRPDFDAA